MRNERIKQKCANVNCRRARPKPRTAPHARTLRDDSYQTYEALNGLVHGPAMPPEWQPSDCGCCGAAPKGVRHMDRDHGHDRSETSYGRPRGLACPGDWGCNKLMSRLTLAKAQEIVAYLQRVEDHYAHTQTEGAS
jgi:hypothetical protein